MRNGLLDRGERGEVVARMLIVEAYDCAVIAVLPQSDNQPGQQHLFSLGCTLIGWIEQMFPDEVADIILNSTPANCGNQSFREAFKDAWIRVTHFTKAADDHVFNTHSMFAAFVRGMAFICRNGESFVDLILPILLFDSKIGSSVMTAIFIQVKRRVKAGHYVIDAEKQFDFFAPEPNLVEDERPYVTLVMDLGVKNTIPGKATVVGVTKKRQIAPQATSSRVRAPPTTPSKIKVSATPRRSLRRRQPTHPRYEIYVSGCSNRTYKVIAETQRQKY